MSAQLTLQTAVSEWERRRKWGVIVELLPYAMTPGLAVGTALALYARLRPGPADTVSLSVALGGALLGVLVLFGYVFLRRRSPVESARWFDLRFGLQERVSTALELIDGRITADGRLLEHQVTDAQQAASRVKAAALLPFKTDGRMWVLNLILLALLAFLMLVTAPVAGADDSARERAAIDGAAAELSEIIQELAADPTLNDEQRGPLLDALQTQLDTLRDPDLTLDEALATLADVEATLSQSAESIEQDLEQAAQAEAEANAAIQGLTPSADAQASLQDSIEAMEGDLENMTQEQMDAAARALENAANALEETNPQAAQSLRDAAEALREGDTQAAQDALRDAAAQAERAQSERGEQADAQRQMERSASQASEAQQQAAQEGQNQQQAGQQGEDAGAQGDTSAGQQGGTMGDMSSEGLMDGEGMNSALSPSDDATQGENNQDGQIGRGGDGMGDGQGLLDQDASAQAQARDPNAQQQENNPDGGGEREYEAVFSPRFSVEAAGEDEVRLGADPGDAPLMEGDFDDNPVGESVVPYNQVFSSYADAASRALESDYIPLGMRDVIRDYFSSLDPQE
jgi:hypothetical protein